MLFTEVDSSSRLTSPRSPKLIVPDCTDDISGEWYLASYLAAGCLGLGVTVQMFSTTTTDQSAVHVRRLDRWNRVVGGGFRMVDRSGEHQIPCCVRSVSIAIASLKDDWREVEVSSLPGV